MAISELSFKQVAVITYGLMTLFVCVCVYVCTTVIKEKQDVCLEERGWSVCL